MAEVFSSDNSVTAEVMESQEADIAESLRIGEELEAAHDQRLAGKYKNAEELEKAYLELQSKLGQQSNDAEEPEATEEPEQQEEDQPEESNDDTSAEMILQMNDEFLEKGELSSESLDKLKGMSSADLVDAYFKAQDRIQVDEGVDLSEAQVRQIQDTVGGPQQYDQLVSWAADNFSPDEVQAFDDLVESGNVSAINLALQALYYRYTEVNGVEGQTIQGKAATPTEVFRSQAELVKAMDDPRYENDPAYRRDVLNKLDRSDLQF
jgi:hypothetical protein